LRYELHRALKRQLHLLLVDGGIENAHALHRRRTIESPARHPFVPERTPSIPPGARLRQRRKNIGRNCVEKRSNCGVGSMRPRPLMASVWPPSPRRVSETLEV